MSEVDVSGSGSVQFPIPVIPEDQPKQVFEFRGEQPDATRHWSNGTLTIPSDTVKSMAVRPLEPLVGTMPQSAPPTDYEVRRDALMAAATYCSSGGWGGMAAVLEQAKLAEKYLRGKA